MIYMIPIPVNCPDGYEPIAYREPAEGESYVTHGRESRQVFVRLDGSWIGGDRLIVQAVVPPYDWANAPFVPDGWWLTNITSIQYQASEHEPRRGAFEWIFSGKSFKISRFMQWTPPGNLGPKDKPIQKPGASS